MTSSVRIPADVDAPDRLVAGLTARQLVLLATTGVLLYCAWTATRTVVPIAVFAVAAIPVGALAVVVALGQRDGLPLDRLLAAALRQRFAPRCRVAAPEGVRAAPPWLTTHATTGPTGRQARAEISPAPLRLPAHAVRTGGTAVGTDTGVVDLGVDGLAVIAVASTVNFALRTPGEQEALVAGFARYLHALSAPIQVVVRTDRLDLTGQISQLREQATGLPHPALETAALEHADYLAQLAGDNDLLRRQVLLVLREPAQADATPFGGTGWSASARLAALLPGRGDRRRRDPVDRRSDEAGRRAAEARLIRRLTDAVELLAAAGIALTPLDAGQATAVLAAACNPDTLLPVDVDLAGADDVITTTDTGYPFTATDGDDSTDDYGDGYDPAGWGEQHDDPADGDWPWEADDRALPLGQQLVDAEDEGVDNLDDLDDATNTSPRLRPPWRRGGGRA